MPDSAATFPVAAPSYPSTPQLFRSPGGDWSPFLLRACAAYGLAPLDWDVDPQDWTVPGTKRIVHAMLRARPGEIVLCHDGGGNRIETIRALKRVLPAWQARGWTTMPLVLGHQSAPTAPTPPSPGSPSPGSPSPSPTRSTAPAPKPTATVTRTS